MLKRPHYIAFGFVVVLVLIVLNLPSHAASQLKLAIGGFFLPLFGLAASIENLGEHGADALMPRRLLLSELEQLRQENQQLRLRLMQSEEVWRQNERLQQMLVWQKQGPWELRPAHVIGRDPANWWRTLNIDLGKRDGLRTNMPVLTAEGLVGRVADVGWTRSQIVLVGDPHCRVSALVQETRDHGIISPSSSAGRNSFVELTYLANNSLLKPGQLVVTSGLGVFPKGIYIGQIVDTRPLEHGLYREARVKLGVDLNRLEEVWVMFQ